MTKWIKRAGALVGALMVLWIVLLALPFTRRAMAQSSYRDVFIPAPFRLVFGGGSSPNDPVLQAGPNGTLLLNGAAIGAGGITQVATLPATCTAGTSQPVSITGALVIGGVSFGAGTVFYCDSTNHYSPVSQGSGAGPIVGWYLGPQCPPSNAAQCFNTPANTQVDNTATWTNAGSTITVTSGVFTAADVGKQAWGYSSTYLNEGGCNPFQPQPAANYITLTHLTVATFVDSNHITLSGTPVNPSLGAGTGCFIWGSPDDAGAAALEAAYDVATSCPRVTLSAGYYLFTAPHFTSQPNACNTAPEVYFVGASSLFGNLWYAVGIDLEGRGVGATKIYLPPDFPQSGLCNSGLTASACFNVPVEGKFHDFAISSGSGRGSIPSAKSLIAVGVGSLENFTCDGVSSVAAGGTFGIEVHAQAQLQQVNASACGTVGFHIMSDTGPVVGGIVYTWPAANCYRCSSDNSAATANIQLEQNSSFGCRSCQTFGNQGGTGFAQWRNLGGELWIDNSVMGYQESSTTATTAYACATNAGCILHASHVTMGKGSSATTTNGIQCLVACTNYLDNSYITAFGAGNTGWLQDVAGSKTFDLGGNTLLGGATVNGALIGEAFSANLTIVTAAKTVLSAGWGSTAAVTALSGGDFPIQFTITNSGTGQGASPTITYTFPTALAVSPFSCAATQVGGTNATGTFTTSALSGTGATFTFSLTPTAASTEIVNVNCVTP